MPEGLYVCLISICGCCEIRKRLCRNDMCHQIQVFICMSVWRQGLGNKMYIL